MSERPHDLEPVTRDGHICEWCEGTTKGEVPGTWRTPDGDVIGDDCAKVLGWLGER